MAEKEGEVSSMSSTPSSSNNTTRQQQQQQVVSAAAVTPIPASSLTPSLATSFTKNKKNNDGNKTAVQQNLFPSTKETTAKQLAALESHFTKRGKSTLQQFVLQHANLKTSFVPLNTVAIRKPHDRRSTTSPTTTTSLGKGPPVEKPPEPIDMIFGRGTHVAAHPGNWFFRQVILMNKEYYHAHCNGRTVKPLAASFLIHAFQTAGIRFLEEATAAATTTTTTAFAWRVASPNRVLEKFMQSLREKKWQQPPILPHLLGLLENNKPTTRTLSRSLVVFQGRKSPAKAIKERGTQPAATNAATTSAVSRVRQETIVDVGACQANQCVKGPMIKASATAINKDDALPASTDAATNSIISGVQQSIGIGASQSLKKCLEQRGTTLSDFVHHATLTCKNFDAARERARAVWDDYEQRQGANSISCLPSIIKHAQPIDVLMGRDSLRVTHSGNMLFRHILEINREFYQQSPKMDKNGIVVALLGRFVDAGSRFLHLDSTKGEGPYQEVPFERAFEKIRWGLQDKYLSKHDHQSLSTCLGPRATGMAQATTKTKKRKSKDADLVEHPRGFGSGPNKSLVTPHTVKIAVQTKTDKIRHQQHIESLLSVGHFALRSRVCEADGGDDRTETHTLQEIRRAIRSVTPSVEPTNNQTIGFLSSMSVNVDDPAIDALVQVYQPSRLGKFDSGVMNPLPVFFSGE